MASWPLSNFESAIASLQDLRQVRTYQIAPFVQAECIALGAVAVQLFFPFHHVCLAPVFLDEFADTIAGTSKNCRCRLMPQNCRRMIPLCSRFDSLAFTFLPVSISSEIDFSRSPDVSRAQRSNADKFTQSAYT
jgi:hypothetical protein